MGYEEEVNLMIGDLMDTVDAEWQTEIERLAMLDKAADDMRDDNHGYDCSRAEYAPRWDEV